MFKKKLIITWDDFNTFAKLCLVFVFSIAVIIITSSVVLFSTYHKQIKREILAQVKHDIEHHALGLQRRSETAATIANQLSNLITYTNTKSNFEEILMENLQAQLDYYSLPKQITYYSLESDEFFTVTRDTTRQETSFNAQQISEIRASGKKNIVVFPVDRTNGNVYVGTATYDENNKQIGTLIIVGNFSQIFEEIETTTSQMVTSRAVAQKSGEYVWKHKNYSTAYPTKTNIIEDFPKLPKDFFNKDSDAMIYEKKVISYSTIMVPNSEFEALIFQVLDYDPFLQTVHALKNTLWGVGLGYIGILGTLFLYVSRLIGVEIKFREIEIKEEKQQFTISENKKEKILRKLDKQ